MKKFKVLFIYPSMGNQENYRAIKIGRNTYSWCLEPLTIASLYGLTPNNWDFKFFDDRIERIDYDTDCDLVAITAETYTARRAYEISKRFRSNGKKVVMGGFHVSMLPDEALQNCDSVLIGEAEKVWKDLLKDAERGTLKSKYFSKSSSDKILLGVKTNREVYGNKHYLPITLIETGRGCKFRCEFCSVSSFFGFKYKRRPIRDIITEIKITKKKFILFVDDNVCADIKSAKELFKALIPLKIRWVSQAPLAIVRDPELLELMKRSGCIGLLVGLETVNRDNLKMMNKMHNLDIDYDSSIDLIHRKGIKIYSSFVIGYDLDDKKSIQETLDYAVKKRFFISNFYQLTPFPGTALYDRLKKEGRLLYNKWWLDKRYSYGDIVFRPRVMSAKKLGECCFDSRKKFYSIKSIFYRASNISVNCMDLFSMILYFGVNVMTRIENYKKQGRKLGRK